MIYSTHLVLLLDLPESTWINTVHYVRNSHLFFSKGSTHLIFNKAKVRKYVGRESFTQRPMLVSLFHSLTHPIPPPPPRSQPPSLQWLPFRDARNVQKNRGSYILLMVQKSGLHQLRLVVFPHYLQGFIHRVVVWDFFHQQ